MTTNYTNLEHAAIAIPKNRSEAMLLAKEILKQLAIIEQCIDDAIGHCEASENQLPLAA